MKPPFITRVRIKNYKSIKYCDVHLGSLQFLAGRNGSGKSNFLDALAFVRDSMTDIDDAFNKRRGINNVRRRASGSPQNMGVLLDFNIGETQKAVFGFELSARNAEAFKVKKEIGLVQTNDGGTHQYAVDEGKIKAKDAKLFPPVDSRRLYLPSITLPEYRPLYRALRTMGIFNFNPAQMREIKTAEIEKYLKDDGGNIADSLLALSATNPNIMNRVSEYMRAIMPFISKVRPKTIENGIRIVEFWQEVKSQKRRQRFAAHNMSDGTLRALGILTAALQEDKDGLPALIGIAEPEASLHACTVGAIMDVLHEASEKRQIIVTTHSGDMLDHEVIVPENILAVDLAESETRIGPLDDMSAKEINSHLMNAGELLRQDQVRPRSMHGKPPKEFIPQSFGYLSKKQ